MFRKYLLWGIALAGFSVMLGAFGAHGLKTIVPAAQLAVFETGVRYEFMHALALLLLAFHIQQNIANQEQLKRLNKTGNLQKRFHNHNSSSAHKKIIAFKIKTDSS